MFSHAAFRPALILRQAQDEGNIFDLMLSPSRHEVR
jgi:hypothetical protein